MCESLCSNHPEVSRFLRFRFGRDGEVVPEPRAEIAHVRVSTLEIANSASTLAPTTRRKIQIGNVDQIGNIQRSCSKIQRRRLEADDTNVAVIHCTRPTFIYVFL